MNIRHARSASWKRSLALSASLAAAITSALAATPANAGQRMNSDDPPQVVVRYARADLQSDAGALRLYGRIVAAARQVCPDDTRDLGRRLLIDDCRTTAVAQAVSRIGNERLAAIHAARASRTRAA